MALGVAFAHFHAASALLYNVALGD